MAGGRCRPGWALAWSSGVVLWQNGGCFPPSAANRLNRHSDTEQDHVMVDATTFEQEVARLIVEALNLEDVKPESIEPEAALFREGLGLGSVDPLELARAIS